MSGYGSLARGGSSSAMSPLSTLQDTLYALASMLPCCADLSGRAGGAGSALGGSGGDGAGGGAVPGGTALKLNGRAVVLVRLLGEGAVSFVYLARDRESGREFALKVMRCPSGTPTLRLALSEIETTRRFRSPHTIRLLDSCVEQTADGHVVYLFLPLCRGTLQDALAARAVRGETADEASSLRLFRGAAEGLKSMHTWRLPDVGAQPGQAPQPAHADAAVAEDEEHGEEDERRLLPGQEDSGDAAYPPKPPRMEGSTVPSSDGPVGKGGDLCAWAHRDIKPANIMIAPASSGSGEPLAVIMDFGSTCRARIEIKSRREAIIQQDVAAEHSSMPYRAPELFDVKTDAVLDEKVDIWSLGCTYYAMLYGYSPFETPQLVEQGGSIAMAVQSGSWKFPDTANASFSDASKEIIRRCLVLDPRQRADIHEVLELTDKAIAGLQ